MRHPNAAGPLLGKTRRRVLYSRMPTLRRLATCLAPALLAAACATHPPCPTAGQWIAPATHRPIADPLQNPSRYKIILLGEQHDSAADHRWQLETITRLHAANPALVLGFEMFPRAAQPALNAWVAGALTEPAFLARTDWKHVWGFDPALYLPIFRFARDHRIPMIALNVSASTIHRVSTSGFANVPPAQREGIGIPAPPSPGYRAELTEVMGGHGGMPMTPARLDHFIDAQLTWDRAMAEAIAGARAQAPARPMVALMGEGHLENRYGVPHQLDALGLPGALVLLPAPTAEEPFGASYADAVFVEPSPACLAATPPPAT